MTRFVFLAALAMTHAVAQESVDAGSRFDLNELAWLEGCWEGTGFNNRIGECWMSAPDGRLTGMFQMIAPDGGQTLSEFFVLDAFRDATAIRLKHFNADLSGWEARDEYVVFELLETGPDFARFDGLEYRRDDQGRLIIHVTVSRDGEESVERLVLTPVR